jgi:hypothetical protein
MLPDTNPNSDIVEARKSAAEPPKKKKKKRKPYRSRTARITIAFFQLAGFGYAGLIVMLVVMETRLVYPGAFFEDRAASAGAIDSGIETVEYESTDGITLRGRLLEREPSRDIVLFFHGNGTKAAWLDGWLVQLSDQFNATTMIAEYRGYTDEATPDEKGIIEDCFAARDYLCRRYGKSPSEIILYGRSLGGGCAVATAAQGGARALVLDRTFDRLVNVAAEKYPIIPVSWLMRNRYDSIAKLTVYDGPLVMLHGTADRLIPIHHAKTLYDSAGCRQKHWIAVEGFGHNDSLSQQYLSEVAAKVHEFTLQNRR